jgi:hypothetical protein
VYQQQQQQQQQEQQEQDAENPFLDPPFSRIKSFVAKTGRNICNYLCCRLSSSGDALDLDLPVLGRPDPVAVNDERRFWRHRDREDGVVGPDGEDAVGSANLTLKPSVVLQQDGVDVKGEVA